MDWVALARIHRRTALGTALEEAIGCSSESGIMVLEQKPARKQGAPNRCRHRTIPTVSASSLTTIAWWPMPACWATLPGTSCGVDHHLASAARRDQMLTLVASALALWTITLTPMQAMTGRYTRVAFIALHAHNKALTGIVRDRARQPLSNLHTERLRFESSIAHRRPTTH